MQAPFFLRLAPRAERMSGPSAKGRIEADRTNDEGGGARGGRRQLLAPEHRAHPGHQLARREGLGQVVVAAELEPDDAVHLLPLGGEEDEGQALLTGVITALVVQWYIGSLMRVPLPRGLMDALL